jgi:hypothetical protein
MLLTLAPFQGGLSKDTTGTSSDNILCILATMNASYANVKATHVNAVFAPANVLKELAKDIFVSKALKTLLAVMILEAHCLLPSYLVVFEV